MSNSAFVFPGQGSQSIGMLSELADRFPLIIEKFNSVSEHLNFDVWKLVQKGPEEILNQTEHTQVAMLVADVAIFSVIEQQGLVSANMMAGHSLGEYAALVCSGSLNLLDAAALVKKRGQLMQEYVPLGKGAMAAIVGLNDEDVRAVCNKASSETDFVSPANYNSIGQVVIAGHSFAVEKAINIANEMGARMALPIPVSVPCHCMLLKDAADEFANFLNNTNFLVPKLPVISNVNLSTYESVSDIRSLLQKQLYSPVRWVETIELMKKSNIELIIECGPGKVLTSLIKRIDRSIQTISVNDSSSFDALLTLLKS